MGLATQVFATAMLGLVPASWLVIPYVMTSQAFSGIAKDLTKMSSKSAVKLVVPEGDQALAVPLGRGPDRLEERAQGRRLLPRRGDADAGGIPDLDGDPRRLVLIALIVVATLMHGHLGQPDAKAKFRHMFSNNRAVNVLAAARIFLFASRDVWFVVGLPVYLETVLGWSFCRGRRLPRDLGDRLRHRAGRRAALHPAGRDGNAEPDGRTATWLAFVLAAFPAAIAIALTAGVDPTAVIVVGLIAFGVVFADELRGPLVPDPRLLRHDKVAMNVGFYYMANAGGRLVGTVLSGLLYELGSLEACLWASTAFVLVAALLSLMLPTHTPDQSRPADALALAG